MISYCLPVVPIRPASSRASRTFMMIISFVMVLTSLILSCVCASIVVRRAPPGDKPFGSDVTGFSC